MASPIGGGGGLEGFLGPPGSLLLSARCAGSRLGMILGQAGTMGLLLGQVLPEGCQIAVEGGPFAFEGPEGLGLRVNGFFEPADLVAVADQPVANLLLDLGPVVKVFLDLGMLRLGQGTVGRCLVPLDRRLLGPDFDLMAFLLVPVAPGASVSQSLGGHRQVAIELA